MKIHNYHIGSHVIQMPGKIFSMDCSPDGQYILCAIDYITRIYDIKSYKVIGNDFKGHAGFVWQGKYSPDGKIVASASLDTTIRIWESSSQKQIRILEGHTDSVFSVTFSPINYFLASCSADGNIRVWNYKEGKIHTIIECQNSLRSIEYSKTGINIISGGVDNNINIWNSESKMLIKSLKGHLNTITKVQYSLDNKYIVSASYDQTIRIWNTEAGQQIGQNLIGHTNLIYSVAFSPDMSMLVSGGEDTIVKIWNTITQQLVGISDGHQSGVSTAKFSLDGKLIFSGSYDKTLRIIQLQDYKN